MTYFHNFAKTRFLSIPSRQFKHDDTAETLTKKRELQAMITAGMTNQQMADELGITVEALKERRRRKSL